MPKGNESTRFKKGHSNPGRGRSFKNKLLDVIREESLITGGKMTQEQAERAFLKHIAERAFDSSDKDSGTLLKELIGKSYPGLKAALPMIDFKLPEDATTLMKAEAILQAVSNGEVAPDIGVMLIQASKQVIDIEATTELKDRLDAIEKELGLGG